MATRFESQIEYFDRLAAAPERISALLTDQRTVAPAPAPAPARRSW